MAKACTKMVKDCIDAYVKQDLELSHKVIEDDDIVDGFFCHVKEELVRIVRDDTGDVEAAIDLLMIAKYFERIGDHAVNIAGWVIFSITGC